jgi:hypothetical protein
MNAPMPERATADAAAPMRFSVSHASSDAFVAGRLLPADFETPPA